MIWDCIFWIVSLFIILSMGSFEAAFLQDLALINVRYLTHLFKLQVLWVLSKYVILTSLIVGKNNLLTLTSRQDVL